MMLDRIGGGAKLWWLDLPLFPFSLTKVLHNLGNGKMQIDWFWFCFGFFFYFPIVSGNGLAFPAKRVLQVSTGELSKSFTTF